MVLMRDMEMKSLIKEGRVLHKTIDEASFIRTIYLGSKAWMLKAYSVGVRPVTFLNWREK